MMCRNPLCALLVTASAFMLPAASATTVEAADARSIEEFLKLQSNWGTFADAELQFRLEGRYSTVARNALRFRNCSLTFRAAEGVELPKPTGTTVEVTGVLSREGGRLVFLVDQLRELPDDDERLRIAQARLKADQPDEWYELAHWAAGRAAFYEDEALRTRADELYLRGIAVERRAAPNDPEQLLALAGKAARFKLPEKLQQELVHEAYQLHWKAADRADRPALKELAQQVARDLPGAKLPLESANPELEGTYRKAPLETYAAADAATRRKLHRIFYGDLLRTLLTIDAKPDGSNGATIAAALERELPEWTALAKGYRDKELDYRLSKVGTLTREEVLALRDEFVSRDQPGQAKATVERWLAIRAARLRTDDLAGRVHLAGEYVRLLDDRSAARDLLVAAYESNPESQDAAAELRRLGFRLDGDRWVNEAEMRARPSDPVQAAIREGRVETGMTREQVRKALGVPTSVTRVASAAQINEVWVYQQPGGSPLAVHFLRRTRAGGESGVVGISPVEPR